MKKNGLMNFKTIFLLCILIFTVSCAGNKPDVFMISKKKGILKAVVLPLKNNTKNIRGGRIIYRELLATLINDKRFNPVEEGEIRNFMIRNRLFIGDIPNFNQLQQLKKLTKADIVISGNILTIDTHEGDIKISLILWARDINTGKLLWTTYYIKKGEEYRKIMHFGKISTIGGLASRMMDEIVKSWEIQN